MPNIPNDKLLEVPWYAYRTWAATSRFIKADLSRWTRSTLFLAIAGAILAAIGQELASLAAWPKAAQGAAVLASFAVAISAYFGKEALTPNKTSDWVKARSAAESLKAAVYMYRASAPPFDKADRAKALADLVATVEARVDTIQTKVPAAEDPPDFSPLTVDEYIQQRVEEQIAWHDKRACEYQKKNDTVGAAVLWLGAASVVLAVVSALGFTTALIGLIATLTASLSAHSQNQQYQFQIVNLQSASRRLRALKGEWVASGKTDADTADRNAFIRSCEDALAQENSAWFGQWSKQRAPAQPIPQQPEEESRSEGSSSRSA